MSDYKRHKEHVSVGGKPKKVTPEVYEKKIKTKLNPDPIKAQTRKEILKSGYVEPGGQIKTIRTDVHTVGNKAQKAYENVRLRNLFKSGTKASQGLLKYGKYLGKATSAAGLLTLAAMLYANKD